MDILKRFLYIFVCLSLTQMTLTGCYENFEPDIKSAPVLCMNSAIQADSTFEVSLTRTWRWDEGYRSWMNSENSVDVTIKDGSVDVYINGQFKETLRYSENPDENKRNPGYFSTCRPREGDKIRLTGHSPVYGDAEAEVEIPFRVDIENVEIRPVIRSQYVDDYNGVTHYYMGGEGFIKFSDPETATNYYTLIVDESHWWNMGDDDTSDWSADNVDVYGIEYTDPLFTEHMSVFENMTSDSYGCVMFSDRTISGRSYTLNIGLNNIDYRVRNDASDDEKKATIKVALNSVSPSYYNYLIAAWEYDLGTNGMLADIGLADRFPGCSNVSTGAGVVAAYASSVYRYPAWRLISEKQSL